MATKIDAGLVQAHLLTCLDVKQVVGPNVRDLADPLDGAGAVKPLKAAALAIMALALADPAFAQPAPGGALANAGPYAGTSRKDFYKPADRINQIQAKIQQGGLAGLQARRAMTQLTAIRQELQDRIARQNGSLRDWDRELINQKLDALVKQYPALTS